MPEIQVCFLGRKDLILSKLWDTCYTREVSQKNWVKCFRGNQVIT